ncbi:MAG: DUF1045 domain-containing protein [Pelagimonas sp.]|jgi:hypothetical protein|nr:DUF1045 domain-containing protein [Pelagimonas sp.]
MEFTRYAIYFTPPPGALSDFGAQFLGWDIATGQTCTPPEIPGLPLPAHNLTDRPRPYGFHATIKPPFFLSRGRDAAGLEQELATLCARLAGFELPRLHLQRIGGFYALTCPESAQALGQLHAAALRGLDMYRRPADAVEQERRRRARLSPEQDQMLQRWGYPHVLDQFRFHMTLTGPVKDTHQEAVENALSAYLEPLIARPLAIDALTLCGEDSTGKFHQINRIQLTGAVAEKETAFS